MYKFLKSALTRFISQGDSPVTQDETDSIKFAVTILLVEVMYADHKLDKLEKKVVIKLLQEQFALDAAEAIRLFDLASHKMNDVVSLHQYTSRVNTELTIQEKHSLMINLWKVVFADGQVDKYEEHFVRRVADLLHYSHRDFIKAKHVAAEML